MTDVNKKTPLKLVGLLSVAALLAPLTGILGAIPLRTIRRVYGRAFFWLPLIAVAAAFFATGLLMQGVVFATLIILVGVFAEAEERGASIFNASLIAVVTSLGLVTLAAGAWLMRSNTDLVSAVRAEAQMLIDQAIAVDKTVTLTGDSVIQTLPAGAIISSFIALAIALFADRRISLLFRVPRAAVMTRERLREFRIPDLGVWVVMVAILAAFLKHGIPWLEIAGLNAFYVLAAAYFFQGLAVVSQAFRVFRVGPVWQFIWYVMMIVQLFFVVSLLGFADYWLDFRQRLSRTASATADEPK